MYEMPSPPRDTLDAETGSEQSASTVIAAAIKELEHNVEESRKKEDAEELAILRMAEGALNANGGDRVKAIAWLREQADGISANSASAKAAAKWLEHLQG